MKFRARIELVYPFFAFILLASCQDLGTQSDDSNQQPPPPPPTQEVSFQNHVRPIFQRHGCLGCHGGSGSLFLNTQAQVLRGGANGPAVVPGKPDDSNLIKKLSPNPPFGDRMPQGGPYLPDSTVQVIRTWIAQGAKDN